MTGKDGKFFLVWKCDYSNPRGGHGPLPATVRIHPTEQFNPVRQTLCKFSSSTRFPSAYSSVTALAAACQVSHPVSGPPGARQSLTGRWVKMFCHPCSTISKSSGNVNLTASSSAISSVSSFVYKYCNSEFVTLPVRWTWWNGKSIHPVRVVIGSVFSIVTLTLLVEMKAFLRALFIWPNILKSFDQKKVSILGWV